MKIIHLVDFQLAITQPLEKMRLESVHSSRGLSVHSAMMQDFDIKEEEIFHRELPHRALDLQGHSVHSKLLRSFNFVDIVISSFF